METKVKHRGSGFESWHIQGKVYSMYMEVFLEEMSLFMGGGGGGGGGFKRLQETAC